jgi:hypothetical protein
MGYHLHSKACVPWSSMQVRRLATCGDTGGIRSCCSLPLSTVAFLVWHFPAPVDTHPKKDDVAFCLQSDVSAIRKARPLGLPTAVRKTSGRRTKKRCRVNTT